MTGRQFSSFADHDPDVKPLLASLADPISSDDYRAAMERLGHHLARGILGDGDRARLADKDICIVCTVEDADFLARGLIRELEATGFGPRIHLQCLWNGKVREGTVSLSPVLKEYREPCDPGRTVFVVVKSIISGACVVKTNLTRALGKAPDADVFVVAPVLLDGAQQRLEREFPAAVAKRFRYIWFATDFDREGENVLPGIGGSVYERLGLVDEQTKNEYLPDIVRQRRAARFGMPLAMPAPA